MVSCFSLTYKFSIVLFIILSAFMVIYQGSLKWQTQMNISGTNYLGHYYRTQRDENGVPHVYASDIYQAAYAQGFIHAQLRLFQMDILRRVPQGMLSQVVGEKGLELDKFFRTLGIKRNIEKSMDQLSYYQRDVMNHYTKGINDFVFQEMKVHPPQFWLTWTSFKEWRNQDTFAITKMMQYSMTFDHQIELIRYQLRDAIGEDLTKKLFPSGEEGYFWGKDAYIMNDDQLIQTGFFGSIQPDELMDDTLLKKYLENKQINQDQEEAEEAEEEEEEVEEKNEEKNDEPAEEVQQKQEIKKEVQGEVNEQIIDPPVEGAQQTEQINQQAQGEVNEQIIDPPVEGAQQTEQINQQAQGEVNEQIIDPPVEGAQQTEQINQQAQAEVNEQIDPQVELGKQTQQVLGAEIQETSEAEDKQQKTVKEENEAKNEQHQKKPSKKSRKSNNSKQPGKDSRKSKKSTQKKPKKSRKKRKRKPDEPPVDVSVNGSNCWAIHGSYTKSGKPMLMSDPHLNNGIPSIQFAMEINIDGKYTFGFSPPGMPGVFLARTNFFAIAFTSMVADTADLYFEKVDFKRQEYFHDNQWLRLQKHIEEIQIKGVSSPFQLTVYQTKNGPLINNHLQTLSSASSYSALYYNTQVPISIAWSGNKFPIDSIQHGFKYIANPELYATGQKLVFQLQHDYNAVSFSACFATANGDIGYVGLVKQPIRNDWSYGSQIQDGTKAQTAWKGFQKTKSLPYIINPKKGFVSCSNQRIASDNLKNRIAGTAFPMSRAVTVSRQIKKMIQSQKKITSDDMVKLQGNVFDEYGFQLNQMLSKITKANINQLVVQKKYMKMSLLKNARDILEIWDGNALKDSVAASIYYVWEQKFWQLSLGEGQFDSTLEKLSYFKGFNQEQWLIKSFKEWENSQNLHDPICGYIGCIQLIMSSFKEAVQYLRERFGQDTNLWKWGHLHRMHFRHTFSSSKLLKPIFHRSYASDGSRRTINVALYSFPTSGFDGIHSANIRMITSLDDQRDRLTAKYKHPSYWSLDTGVSGVKGSSHYDDLMERHKNLDMIEMNYNMPKAGRFGKFNTEVEG